MCTVHTWNKFLFVVLLFTSPVLAICYYPNGTPTPADVPCLSGDQASWCCGFGYACLSNKLCMATSETLNATTKYVRGSCTDQSWRAANCPSFCVNPDPPNRDNTAGGEGMALCPNATNTYYCIDFNENAVDCAKLENVAVQATGTPQILTTIGYGSLPTSSGMESSSMPVNTSTPVSQSASIPVSKSSLSATSASTAPAKASSLPSSGTIAGASIGATIGILALVLFCIFLYRRRRKNNPSDQKFSPHELMLESTLPPYYNPGEDGMKHKGSLHEAYVPPSELDGRNVSELATRPRTIIQEKTARASFT